MTIHRSEEGPVGLAGLLATAICPRSVYASVLEDIMPVKMKTPDAIVRPLPQLTRDTKAFVITFDGAVKINEKTGSFGMVLWRVPEWKVIKAAE
ncbi:TPA: hypothetical protein N0F65_008635 [Lagenidium giganteum]|uniref:Uncharacterized protein n=1 Tax=Lagenidium giganteum TaxID=4803 RepID=A0AAV2YXU1_9STRA|nr:TPA: hypothetical protein N0F65_008635 [Lagenidium giganteum]